MVGLKSIKLIFLTLAYAVVRVGELLQSYSRLVRVSILALSIAGIVLFIRGGGSDEHVGEPREALNEKCTQAAVQVQSRTPEELSLAIDLSLDVWSENVSFGQPVVVVLSPASINTLKAKQISYEIIVPDIYAAADKERRRLEGRDIGVNNANWFSEYRDVQEIGDYMSMLAENYAALASRKQIGTSIDGQPIRAIEISRGGNIGIVLNGGQHAREWISVMVPLCIADRLLTAHDSDPRIQRILESVSFYIVPLINPDGYLHSWNVDRYWRKNRRNGEGVDLNRNYSVAWGAAGSSKDPQSQNYRGRHAFSEPETLAMKGLFENNQIKAHIDFHSYSRLILYPWHHSRAEPNERAKFAAAADRMSSAMYSEHGEDYKIRPGASLKRGAGGTFTDWSYGERETLSFTIELRPAAGGKAGFVLPPEQIVPTCEESLAAVVELSEWMIRDAAKAAQ